jgi:hypothetical protein
MKNIYNNYLYNFSSQETNLDNLSLLLKMNIELNYSQGQSGYIFQI